MSTKQKIAVLLLALVVLFPVSTTPVSAQGIWGGSCVGFGDVPTIEGFTCLFANILLIALRLIGIGMFLMFVVAGFKLLTASGDPKKAAAAKSTLTAAVAGLALAILAWFILALIFQLTGVDVTVFEFPLINQQP